MIKLKEINFSLIPVVKGSDKHIEYLKYQQEYVKVGFEGHDHLPIVFRIKTRLLKYNEDSYILGNAPFTYGNIWIVRIYKVMLEEEYNYIWFAQRLIRTYFHEFFHIYFFQRLKYEDMIGYKIRSKNWAWNERIVKNLALYFTRFFIEDYGYDWINLFVELSDDYWEKMKVEIIE